MSWLLPVKSTHGRHVAQAGPHHRLADTSTDSSSTHVNERWRLDLFSLLPASILLGGLLLFSYPSVANWISQYNQAHVIVSYTHAPDAAEPAASRHIHEAQAYNNALTAGAVLEANTNVPTGNGSGGDPLLDYDRLLQVNSTGLMARIRIPKISVDLPIYHGTSDETLLMGVGHLRGTSLPVGGSSTRSVLTAHRGLANARMFTDLDELIPGDIFSVEVFGKVFTYRIFDKKVVNPDETEALRAEEGRDLATLVTCTPLGINSHRILVTGERLLPVPQEEQEAVGSDPAIPAFPWWALWIPAGVFAIGVYVWTAGRPTRNEEFSDEANTASGQK